MGLIARKTLKGRGDLLRPFLLPARSTWRLPGYADFEGVRQGVASVKLLVR